MIYKCFAFSILLTSLNVLADCSTEDLQGEWEIKYMINAPQQVGICDVVFDNNLEPSGSCYNITYEVEGDIFDGAASITDKCAVKGYAYLQDGQKITLNLKMSADKQTMTGKFTSKLNEHNWKGTMKARKAGGLSCTVVKN